MNKLIIGFLLFSAFGTADHLGHSKPEPSHVIAPSQDETETPKSPHDLIPDFIPGEDGEPGLTITADFQNDCTGNDLEGDQADQCYEQGDEAENL